MRLPAIINLPSDAVITQRQLQERLGNPRQFTLWRWVRDGKLPKPLQSNGRANLYIVSDLEKALKAHGIEVVRDDYQ